MSRYRKGYRYELKIRNQLREEGWTVYRLAGSKPIDLVAFRRDEVALIECKSRPPTEADYRRLAEIWIELGGTATCLLVYPRQDGDVAAKVEDEHREWRYLSEL